VLRIVLSIGGVEVNDFAVWHDKAGNAVSQPLAGVTDPKTGTHFPDLNASGGEATQTNLIFPEPCDLLRKDLPEVSVIRPSSPKNSGAMAAVTGLTADGLFKGQSADFFATVTALAQAADAAVAASDGGRDGNRIPQPDPRRVPAARRADAVRRQALA